MKCNLIYPLLLVLSIGIISCEKKKKGCTDPRAFNYDISAEENDGTCLVTDYNEGNYLFYGTKNTVPSGNTLTIYDSIAIKALVAPQYIITGMMPCEEIIVNIKENTWELVSSSCGLQNWHGVLLVNEANSISFEVVENTIRYRYTGQLYKIQ